MGSAHKRIIDNEKSDELAIGVQPPVKSFPGKALNLL